MSGMPEVSAIGEDKLSWIALMRQVTEPAPHEPVDRPSRTSRWLAVAGLFFKLGAISAVAPRLAALMEQRGGPCASELA